jgi:hypothetical protein
MTMPHGAEAAVVMLAISGVRVVRNYMNGGDFGVFAAGNAHVLTITHNTVTDTARGGIRLSPEYAESANGRVTITFNTIVGSGGPGVDVASRGYSGPMDVRYNRIAGIEGQPGLVNDADEPDIDARLNWWGCNDAVAGNACGPAGTYAERVTYRPWLLLTVASDPGGLLRAPDAIITAALHTDSEGATLSGPFFQAVPVHFTATIGEIEPTSEMTDADLRATALWRAGQAEAGRICASADHQELCLDVEATPSGPEVLPPGETVPPGEAVPPVPPAGVRPPDRPRRPIVRVTG